MPTLGIYSKEGMKGVSISRIVLLLTCILAIGVLGCGDGEAERKKQALDAAQSWTENVTQPVIAEVVTLVTSGVPGASLFSDLIASQIADSLTWGYSDPVKITEGIYAVTATVSTQASLDLPLVGSKTYKAALPFDLQVDVNTGSITQWSVDLDNASVDEI